MTIETSLPDLVEEGLEVTIGNTVYVFGESSTRVFNKLLALVKQMGYWPKRMPKIHIYETNTSAYVDIPINVLAAALFVKEE